MTEPMSRADEIMGLFEGSCPQCSGHTEPVDAGGTLDFVVMQGWITEAVEQFMTWTEARPGGDVIGTINFECENMHKHTIDFGRWGEWL